MPATLFLLTLIGGEGLRHRRDRRLHLARCDSTDTDS